MPRGKAQKTDRSNASALGFEATLWATADKLRGNLDAAEYKHVVLVKGVLPKEYARPHLDKQSLGGKARGDISIFGQESNPTTWRLARMNLAIRSIERNLGLDGGRAQAPDSFHRDLHKGLKADYILANPPFNMSDWGGKPFDEKMNRFTAALEQQFTESAKQEAAIKQNLKGLGYVP